MLSDEEGSCDYCCEGSNIIEGLKGFKGGLVGGHHMRRDFVGGTEMN